MAMNIAGRQDQPHGNQAEHHRVCNFDLKNNGLEPSTEEEGHDDPYDDPHSRQQHPLPHHQAPHVLVLGPQGHPNPNFVTPLTN